MLKELPQNLNRSDLAEEFHLIKIAVSTESILGRFSRTWLLVCSKAGRRELLRLKVK